MKSFAWKSVVAATLLPLLATGQALADTTYHIDFGDFISNGAVKNDSDAQAIHGQANWTTSPTTIIQNLRFSDAVANNPISFNVSGWHTSDVNAPMKNFTADLEMFGGGMGVAETGAPEHALDNEYGYDLIIFEFDHDVSLNQVVSGWPNSTSNCNSGDCDSDISVLALTGGNHDIQDYNQRWEVNDTDHAQPSVSMLDYGWELIGHYTNAGGTTTNVNSGVKTSRFWAIGAYLDGIAPAGYTSHNDYLKLLGLTVTKHMGGGGGTPMPEPSVAILMLLGLLGLRQVQRRRA